MNTFGRLTGFVTLAVLLIGGSVLLSGAIVLLLWNWVIVSIFGAPIIDYWQAVGLALVLGVIGGVFSRRSSH